MKKTLFALFIMMVIFGTRSVALAAPSDGTNPPTSLRLSDTSTFDDPDDIVPFIERLTNWVFAILLTLAVAFILLAAFSYLTSKGGEGVETAHKKLLWAAVAIAIAVLAKGFVTVIRILTTNEAIPNNEAIPK